MAPAHVWPEELPNSARAVARHPASCVCSGDLWQSLLTQNPRIPVRKTRCNPLKGLLLVAKLCSVAVSRASAIPPGYKSCPRCLSPNGSHGEPSATSSGAPPRAELETWGCSPVVRLDSPGSSHKVHLFVPREAHASLQSRRPLEGAGTRAGAGPAIGSRSRARRLVPPVSSRERRWSKTMRFTLVTCEVMAS
jgi:hypothetical protein